MGWASRVIRTRTGVLIAAVAVRTVTIFLCGLAPSFAVAVGLYLVSNFASGVASPIRQGMINHHIPSSQRATILSVDSLFSELGSGIGQSGWGYLARRAGHRPGLGGRRRVPGARHPAAPARAPRGSGERSLRRTGADAGAGRGGPVSTGDATHRQLPAGTLTFLFTDIEGSTRLVQELGEARFHAVLEDHGRLVAAALDARGRAPGRAWRATRSSTCSSAPPRPSRRSRRRSARSPRHVFPDDAVDPRAHGPAHRRGEPRVRGDRRRLRRLRRAPRGAHRQRRPRRPGAALRAARACSCATRCRRASRCAISASTASRTSAAPERVFQLVIGGLPADFPPLRTLNAVPNNLPMQVTSFVGREREIAEGVRLFQQARVLTLTGPGRHRQDPAVAPDRGRRSPTSFPDGVSSCALAPISDPDLVAAAIVEALAPRSRQHPAARPAVAALSRPAGAAGAGQLRAGAGRGAAGGRAASRQSRPQGARHRRAAPLRISGEQEMPVPPLALPDPGDARRADVAIRGGAAVHRARRRGQARLRGHQRERPRGRRDLRAPGRAAAGDRAGRGADQAAAARGDPDAACRAASGLLQSGARDLPERQQTLRGAIAWSYDLLDEPGRRLFARLAVFAGGGALDDVEAICGGPDLGIDVLDGLEALVDQSLVRQEEHDGEARRRSCWRRSASTRSSGSTASPRRGGGAQPSRAPLPRPRRGGRAAPAARRAARLARPAGARARQPARGVRFLRRLRAHPSRRCAWPARSGASGSSAATCARGCSRSGACSTIRRRTPTPLPARRPSRPRAASPTGSPT